MSTNQIVIRRYQFALYPTVAQADLLHVHRRMMADLWNALKQRCEDVYRRSCGANVQDRRFLANESVLPQKRSLTFFDLTNELTALRRECPEWQAIPAVTLHRVAKQLTDAFHAFFRRCRTGDAPGYPKWRSRERTQSIPLGTGTRAVRDKKMWKTGWRFCQRDDNRFSWSLYYGDADLKDRATWIHARGRFPREVEEFNNADIIWRDGKWHLSVCVEQHAGRWPGREAIVIRLDAIGCFATVNDIPSYPDGLAEAFDIEQAVDDLKSVRDGRWKRPPRREAPDRAEWRKACIEISRLAAQAARIRRNALHVWTARIIARASDITIVMPASIKEETASPRGDQKRWGANVEVVSELNRHILNQAPAAARAMLEYKAAEAGIRCDVVADEAPNTAAGRDLVTARKAVRSVKHQAKKED